MTRGNIEHPLMWIQQHTAMNSACSAISDAGCKVRSDVEIVCFRGLLSGLMCLPYDRRTDLTFAVQRVGDVLYLAEFQTPQKEAEVLQETPKSSARRKMMYWGYNFETYMTTDNNGESLADSDVNAAEGFSLVVYSRLAKKHGLLYFGETDCYDEVNETYVELKTSRLIEKPGGYQELSLFRKALKWWLQSFLVNTPVIIVGMSVVRDNDTLALLVRACAVGTYPYLCRYCM